MAYDEGDWVTATLTVDPFDGTTTVTLTVIAPDGTTSTPSTSGSSGTWTAAPYELTMPGEWVERWTVTGTGKSKERRVLQVAPDPTAVPSGTRVYATSADYSEFVGKAPPSGIRRALVEASRDIDKLLLCTIYETDTNGLPTDADVIAAMRDATCAQAEYSKAAGDSNAVGAAQYHSMTLGSASLTRGYNSAGSSAPGRYSPKAIDILQRAGLTGHEPIT